MITSNCISVTYYYTLHIREHAFTTYNSISQIIIISSSITLHFQVLLWWLGCHHRAISHSSSFLPLQALRPAWLMLIFHEVTFAKISQDVIFDKSPGTRVSGFTTGASLLTLLSLALIIGQTDSEFDLLRNKRVIPAVFFLQKEKNLFLQVPYHFNDI